MSDRKAFMELVTDSVRSGHPPEGIDLSTHIIANLSADSLTQAAMAAWTSRAVAPTDDEVLGETVQISDIKQYTSENPTPEISLARDVMDRQKELSRPIRRLASAASFLVLFAVGGYLQHETYTPGDREATAQDQTDTATYLKSDVVFGLLFGATGAGIVYSSRLVAGRLARKPAQRIVSQVEGEPT